MGMARRDLATIVTAIVVIAAIADVTRLDENAVTWDDEDANDVDLASR